MYLFHPRYLHNDIFRYMTREITHDISHCGFHAVLHKLITLVVIATGPNFSYFLVFTATFLYKLACS